MSGLMVLKERIDATEALIAIDLDNRRNELVAFDYYAVHACLLTHEWYTHLGFEVQA